MPDSGYPSLRESSDMATLGEHGEPAGGGRPPTAAPLGQRRSGQRPPMGPEPRRYLSGEAVAPSPWQAVRAHPALFVLPALLLLVVGFVVGLQRSPAYGADTRLIVGRIDVESQAVPGYVAANQSLAGTYARLVETDAVGQLVADQLHLPLKQVSGHLKATNIPESAIILVSASAPDKKTALALDGAATSALSRYVASTNSDAATSNAVLQQYQQASEAYNRATVQRDSARAAINSYRANVSSSATPPTSLTDNYASAQASVDRAQLQVNTLQQSYSDSLRVGTQRGDLTILSAPTASGSDRLAFTEKAAGGGLVAGLVIGLALAMSRSRRAGVRRRS